MSVGGKRAGGKLGAVALGFTVLGLTAAQGALAHPGPTRQAVEPLPALEVSAERAAQVLAFEERLFGAIERYGLRKT